MIVHKDPLPEVCIALDWSREVVHLGASRHTQRTRSAITQPSCSYALDLPLRDVNALSTYAESWSLRGLH